MIPTIHLNQTESTVPTLHKMMALRGFTNRDSVDAASSSSTGDTNLQDIGTVGLEKLIDSIDFLGFIETEPNVSYEITLN